MDNDTYYCLGLYFLFFFFVSQIRRGWSPIFSTSSWFFRRHLLGIVVFFFFFTLVKVQYYTLWFSSRLLFLSSGLKVFWFHVCIPWRNLWNPVLSPSLHIYVLPPTGPDKRIHGNVWRALYHPCGPVRSGGIHVAFCCFWHRCWWEKYKLWNSRSQAIRSGSDHQTIQCLALPSGR